MVNSQYSFYFLHENPKIQNIIIKSYYEASIELINTEIVEEISVSKSAHSISKAINYEGRLIFDLKFSDGIPRKFLDNTKLKELGWESTKLEVDLKKYVTGL